MNFTSLAVLALLGVTLSSGHEFAHKMGREVKKNRFGAMEVVEHEESGFKKTVMWPFTDYIRDYAQQAEYIKEATEAIKINKQKIEDGTIYSCESRVKGDPTTPGYFIPIYVGEIGAEKGNTVSNFEGRCFENINFSFAATENEDEMKLIIETEGPKWFFCHDWFFFATPSVFHVENFDGSGKHEITFKNLNENAKIDILKNGVQIYMFCDGYVDTFVSVLKTLLAFIGGTSNDPTIPIWGSHIPPYMSVINQLFLKEAMGYDMPEREIKKVEYDPNLIQSGDFLAIMRLDGLDPIIMYGSGTHAGHSVVALRMEDGELYIIESQDGWYWPRNGIQGNKWSDWIKWAEDASFHVVHMPLNAEARAKFNETAAREFFRQTEGLPYGMHNFLFGWIDTPVKNWPPLLPVKLVPIVFSMLESVVPDVVDIFIGQALNKRLGTQGLKMAEIAAEAAKRDMTIEDVMAIPEHDHWIYEGLEPVDGWSYVCSAYVAAVYKAAGLFDNYDIQATEFTPKDVYTLDIFDTNFKVPEQCAIADPDQPYCQLLGKYRMNFPQYSTVKPYEKMAERCPTIAPLYERPANC